MVEPLELRVDMTALRLDSTADAYVVAMDDRVVVEGVELGDQVGRDSMTFSFWFVVVDEEKIG